MKTIPRPSVCNILGFGRAGAAPHEIYFNGREIPFSDYILGEGFGLERH